MLLRFLERLFSPTTKFERLAEQRLAWEFSLSQAQARELAPEAAKILAARAAEIDAAFLRAYPLLLSGPRGFWFSEGTAFREAAEESRASFSTEAAKIKAAERQDLERLVESARSTPPPEGTQS